jgi:outer membrane immunogenic protein
VLVPVTPLTGFDTTGFGLHERRNQDGFVGGGQIGYNYQFTPGSGWVVGVEADIQGTDFGHRRRDDPFGSPYGNIFTAASVADFGLTPGLGIAVPVGTGNVALFNNGPSGFDRSRIDWFATVRGRLGYAIDHLLIYGTGGVAFADRRDRPNPCPGCSIFGAGAGIPNGQTLVGTGFYTTPDAETAGGAVSPTTTAFVYDNRGNDVGWTAGGGVEYAFSNNLTIKIEGLYVAFGRDRNKDGCCVTGDAVVGVTNTGAPAFASQLGLRFDNRRQGDDVGVVRVGLNWKFNTP